MPSITSSKLVTLTLAIFVICLFFLIPSHTPFEGESNINNLDTHEASKYHFDTSFIKTTGEKITNAFSGKLPGDHVDEDDEREDDKQEVISKDHSFLEHDPEEDEDEAQEEDTLTDEEKAVAAHHASKGSGPLRERPTPKKPTKTNKKPAAEHKKIDHDPEVLTDEEQAVEAYHEAKNKPNSSKKGNGHGKPITLKDMEKRRRN